MQTAEKFFETSNRKLEKFLYMHDISWDSWKKDEYDLVVWRYAVTPELITVVNEYITIVARRKATHSEPGEQSRRAADARP